MVADPGPGLLGDQGAGADVPVPFGADGDGRVKGPGGDQGHAIGQGVALGEAHFRPGLGPFARLHQPRVGQKLGVLQRIRVRGADRATLQPRAAAQRGLEHLAQHGGVDDGGDGAAVLDHGDGHAPPRLVLHIGDGAVDRIDDEDALLRQAVGVVRCLLRKPAVVGPRRQQGVAQQLIDRQIGAGDGRTAFLGPDLQPRLAMLQRQLARRQGRVADQVEVGQKVGHFPAMATASNIREGLLKEPRNSRSDPRTSRA
ncbi:hypothetical protein D3C86_1204360 [compost metagenome]